MRIVLADDHQIVREGLRAILEREPGFRVIGEVADGRAAISAVAELQPDVVVMDVAMPGSSGLEATKHIAAEHGHVKIIALSMHTDPRGVAAMLSAGASGYVVKSSAGEDLVRAVEAVSAGHRYLGPELDRDMVDALLQQPEHRAGGPRGPLTGRERDVLRLLAEGGTSKEIAKELDIAVSTVDTHRREIMRKLDLRSIPELTKYAIREGLTSVER